MKNFGSVKIITEFQKMYAFRKKWSGLQTKISALPIKLCVLQECLLLVCVSVVFVACVTTPKFLGTGDLCGIVVDEKNNPICDFSVCCKGKLIIPKYAFTNESGIFVFHDLPSGEYTISGKKGGYAKLEETKYQFVQRDKIFCCQLEEINTVLDYVEKLILAEDYEQCIDWLNCVYCDEKSNEEKVVNYYLGKLKEKIGIEEEIDDLSEVDYLSEEKLEESDV